ncbi:MAG TPA: mercuric transport protein MerTP [Flavobacteriales bacterium]|nr:mercuric transport protein MerTP [Flavobacteriales bacterium]
MKQGKLIGVSILSAIAASLCCITPVLALIAGTSGAASNFAWIEPARPYLFGVTIVVLGFAWYQKLKPAKSETDNCNCETKKASFLQSKLFLGIVTVFAAIMLAFPYYAQIFYSNEKKQVVVSNPEFVQKAEFSISGMTCESCEQHVVSEINKLGGIVYSEVSYTNENAIVEFDSTQTSIEEITKAINSTGYKVESHKTLK